MKELLKSIAYSGIGAALFTEKKIEKLKDDLVEQDKINQDEAKQFVDELVNKSDSIKALLDLKINQIDEEIIKQFDFPTNADFTDLQPQVEALQVALNKEPEANLNHTTTPHYVQSQKH